MTSSRGVSDCRSDRSHGRWRWMGRAVRGTSVMLICLVKAVSLAGVVQAEFKPGRYIESSLVTDWFARHVRDGMVNRLDLSDRQVEQIQLAIDPHCTRLMEEIEAVKETRMRLVETIRTEPYDVAAVGMSFEELRAKELTLLIHAGSIYQQVWQILTAEQKAEADEVVAEIVTATELRFNDFRESFLAGELLGRTGQ